jgi:hypothetical protein
LNIFRKLTLKIHYSYFITNSKEAAMKTKLRILTLAVLILTLLGGMAVFYPRGARANVITVDIAGDSLAVDGFCSLREAIDNANQDSMVHGDCIAGSGSDIISLPGWLFTLQLSGAGEDGNQTGDLDITGELIIVGVNPAFTIIQAGTSSPLGSCGDCLDRVFHVLPGADITFNKVTIRHGHAPDGAIGSSGEHGGGIKNEGEVSLSNTIVTKNMAGDGYDSSTYAGGFAGNGGGIHNTGILTAFSSRITQNRAGHGGDGWEVGYGQFGGYGGGIYAGFEDPVFLTSTVVSDNRAGDGGRGGDSSHETAGSGGAGGKGGGVYCGNCTLVMRYASLNSNHTGRGGDGGHIIGESYNNGGNGGNSGDGGGLLLEGADTSATLIASRVHNNQTSLGGFAGSSTLGSSGGPGKQGNGGGVYSEDDAQLNLTGSTISSNEAYHGGGISVNTNSGLTAYNSTFSANMANYNGGGLHGDDGGTIELAFVTVTGNIADNDFNGGGTGGGFSSLEPFTITNTILAANFDYSGNNPDCHGYLNSGDYNILGVADSSSCIDYLLGNDQSGTVAVPLDPLLSPLTNNGGPTQTHALDATSPAWDQIPHGVNGCISGITRDQRFIVRFANCDIGAFEYDQSTYHIYLPLVMR